MWINHSAQRRGCTHSPFPPEPLSAASSSSSTQTLNRHCACSKQLNMNAASRLKTSHIQVRISPVYLLVKSRIVCLPLLGPLCVVEVILTHCRRLCVFKSIRFFLKLKSLHVNKLQERLPADQMHVLVGNINACCNVSRRILLCIWVSFKKNGIASCVCVVLWQLVN